jgi:guanylate kinase
MERGLCVVLIGVVASGKSTIINRIIETEPGAVMMRTYTTRKPRESENGKGDRIFVSREEFERMVDEDKFIEWDEHFGFLYGSSRDTLEGLLSKNRFVLVNINVDGAFNYMRRVPNLVTIFISVPENQILGRIRKRGKMNSDELKRRLAEAKREISFINQFDHVVENPNGSLDQAVERIREIMHASLDNIA